MADFPSILDAPLRQRLAELGVRPEDIDERFIRGTGAGGQKINKTSSTVWLRHRVTGVEVRCQEGRSQTDNRLQAWAELASRLSDRRASAHADARSLMELYRRRNRQKSYTQKKITVDNKKHHARRKQARRSDHGDW